MRKRKRERESDREKELEDYKIVDHKKIIMIN